ncbi:endonuclease VII domain-containing protein [Catellatospora tritici]|uniref:endonuclease VII domain-containing protein n=1 Tax=Catellatospora tritici TaxID=2851566 RepID=UPI001C2D9728|nr:endonuclease VII domain-containing protein [Catellatospora tritici]MBV1852937.1 endonuclease VII domain-containing protein [Catellatospora tritici]
MGQAEFDAMLAAQGGVCAICGAPAPEHVDHDHLFGNVRGILCFNCNGGLGQFKDDRANLRKAIDYLEETSWQRVLVHPGVYRLVSPRRERRLSPSS